MLKTKEKFYSLQLKFKFLLPSLSVTSTSFHTKTSSSWKCAVKPIAVHITTREKFVSAEKRYDVECKSSGSRPEAVLTWWKGSRQIKRMAKNVKKFVILIWIIFKFLLSHLQQFSETGNQTLSVLTFIPVVDDDGKYLTCRAENPFIPDSAIEDKWRLVVHCELLYSFCDFSSSTASLYAVEKCE